MSTLTTIAILGPESVGKTTLAETLAAHYACAWLPEYARTYVEQLHRPYTYDDVMQIAEYQSFELKAKQQACRENGQSLLVCDTDLIITKVWFEHCYQRIPDWLNGAIAEQGIDFYLLCAPDLPWQPDPVRENADLRPFLFGWYRHEIEATGVQYAVVQGVGSERTACAVAAIDKFLEQRNF